MLVMVKSGYHPPALVDLGPTHFRSSQKACARDLDGSPSFWDRMEVQKRGDLHRETSLGTSRRTTPPGGLKIRQEGGAGGGRGPSRGQHTVRTSIPHKFNSFKTNCVCCCCRFNCTCMPCSSRLPPGAKSSLPGLPHHFLDHQTTCSSAAAPGRPYNAGQGSSVFMS